LSTCSWRRIADALADRVGPGRHRRSAARPQDGPFSTAATTAIATCRCTSSVAGIRWANCGRSTSTARPIGRGGGADRSRTAPALPRVRILLRADSGSARDSAGWPDGGNRGRPGAAAQGLPVHDVHELALQSAGDRQAKEGRYPYEKIYCACGDMENRIKECQGELLPTAPRRPHARQPAAPVVFLDGLRPVCALRRIGWPHTRF